MSNKALPEMERDLSFHPVDNSQPRTLTPSQLDDFNRDGIIHPIDIFDEGGIAGHRANFDRLLAQARAAGHDSYSINGYHQSIRSIYRLTQEPRILDCVEDLLGPGFVCWGTHYFAKMPGDGKAVSWHQDAVYWPLTPARTVTVWLAIDDADIGNGAMQVIPGTHTAGQLAHRDSRADEHNVLWISVDRQQSWPPPRSIELRAGQISIHSDMLVHGSEPNPSDRRRCGLTIRYAAGEVRRTRPGGRGIHCRGVPPDSHWEHLPEPTSDDFVPRD